MSYDPMPTQTKSGEREARVSDEHQEETLKAILHELRLVVAHLALITDHESKETRDADQ